MVFMPLPILGVSVLDTVQRWMGKAGYPVLFGLLVSCGLGVPLPEDVPLLLAGWFAASGQMNLVAAAICAWCGIMVGDCILYGLGRRFGMGITELPVIGRHIDKKRIDSLHNQFEKYGIWVVGVGRLFAGVRGVMVVVAGLIRFNFVHFIIADGLAAVVSGGLFMGLGYWGERKIGDLKTLHSEVDQYKRWVVYGLILLAIAVAAYLIWRQRQRRAQAIAIVSLPLASEVPPPDAHVIPDQ